ncbi:hypothetical protein [Candidatus Thioglobus sp.]|uniref:hypothetical protein n=1 Tax=Candidatus Thioglobus sp. TaxID=2026721 RepID=UPI003D142783
MFNNSLLALLLGLLINTQVLAEQIFIGCSPGSTAGQITALSPIEVEAQVQVIVPSFLWFRLGDTFNTVNTVSFEPLPGSTANSSYSGTPPEIGNSIPVSASGGSGSVFVKLQANCGQITLSTTVDNASGLSNGNPGEFINFDQITTTTDNANLAPPVLQNSAIADITVPITNDVVVTDWEANWTYSYKNEELPVSGTYAGTVTHTASCAP